MCGRLRRSFGSELLRLGAAQADADLLHHVCNDRKYALSLVSTRGDGADLHRVGKLVEEGCRHL